MENNDDEKKTSINNSEEKTDNTMNNSSTIDENEFINENFAEKPKKAFYEGGDKFMVGVFTMNFGNAQITQWDRWIPKNGEGLDIIAVGMQESTYKADKRKNSMEEIKVDKIDLEIEELDAENDQIEKMARKMSNAKKPSNFDDSDDSDDSDDRIIVKNADPNDSSIRSDRHRESVKKSHLRTALASHLGDEWYCVGYERRFQMRLSVHARREWEDFIDEVETAGENTGFAHVIANKGGIVLKLNFFDTSMAFVSCHLKPHEGQKNVKARNENCLEILEGARVGNREMDLSQQFHHVFWMGDLNYRSDPSWMDKDDWQAKWDHLTKLVSEQNYQEIWKMDELYRELKAQRVLMGFKTRFPNFPPTFKVLRQDELIYKKNRLPSYCDRILWKSLPGVENRLKVHDYDACMTVTSSDHKPVKALFSIDNIPEIEILNVPSNLKDTDTNIPTLLFTGLKCTNLPIMDPQAAGGSADPYLIIFSDPHELLYRKTKKKKFKTKAKPNNLNPSWDEQLQIPILLERKGDYSGAHIFIQAWDRDFGSPDDIIGVIVLSLDDIIKTCRKGEAFEFTGPLTLNGVYRGTIQGTILLSWPQTLRKRSSFFKKEGSEKMGGCGCLIS